MKISRAARIAVIVAVLTFCFVIGLYALPSDIAEAVGIAALVALFAGGMTYSYPR